jgi:outer membrane receptor protein involved in Fe transport
MKNHRHGVAGAAILAGLGAFAPAFAQPPEPTPPQTGQPAPAEPGEEDRVIVTGSFLRGTPEDAALPVEVFSSEELAEQGAPTALEFAKSLTISGGTTGEAYYFSGPALTGTVAFNLRGIGADKTLTLLNGRRMSDNTSNIPAIALARTEVLKDGAAVIYGADATGGVVNFITRDDFVGLEARGQYKLIEGSDGDYGLGILGGVGDGDVNFMWSLEWEHRSRLESEERDWAMASMDFAVNPAPWSTQSELTAWQPRATLPAIPTATANGEWGTPIGGMLSDFTQASCEAVGGAYVSASTCRYNYVSYYNLVEDNDIYRAFAQLNAAISDDMDFHFDISYGQVKSPVLSGSPSRAFIRGPAMAIGAANQIYVPITNPFAAAFAARAGAPVNTAGFTPATTYRPMAHGGNPMFDGEGLPSSIDNQVWRASAALQGTLGEWAGIFNDTDYDLGVTYSQSISYFTDPDWLGFRLQEALNGFGGPNCSAPDLNPNRFGTQNAALAGKNGCLWWNPFATQFREQPQLGLANPQYVAGTENPVELIRWLHDDRASESISTGLTVDLVFRGLTGIELPGGTVAWALGGQARQLELREFVSSIYNNGTVLCEWPNTFSGGNPTLVQTPTPTQSANFRGCTPDNPGPFVNKAIDPPDDADRQQVSFFGEASIPLLDNLNFQAAVRREEFSGGLGATVYKVSGKWDVWGPFSLRGSYGTNYQAPPIGVIPGEVVNTVTNYTVAGSNWLGGQRVTAPSLTPETATSWNVGAIWQSAGLAPDHDFRLIVDYFNIETEDEIGLLATYNQIAASVFNGTNGAVTTCDPAVNPLVLRVTFNNGCSVGLLPIGAFSSVQTVLGNGPGQATAGFDIQSFYSLPMGPGELTLNLTATNITKLETGPTSLDGVVISTGDDRLGTLNFATIAQAAPEWRANFSVNYRMDDHNFRLGLNYTSAVTDERAGVQYGENGEDWLSTDFTYVFNLTDSTRLTANVQNIFDKDPPPVQEELGYDPRLGNPLGRTIEVGVTQKF